MHAQNYYSSASELTILQVDPLYSGWATLKIFIYIISMKKEETLDIRKAIFTLLEKHWTITFMSPTQTLGTATQWARLHYRYK